MTSTGSPGKCRTRRRCRGTAACGLMRSCVGRWVHQGRLRVGLEPGRVALLVRNSPHYVASYFGVIAAGCVAVPLNVQERASVLSRQIEHAGCSAVIADPQHQEWAR